MSGYWARPEATAGAFAANGRFRSGDVGVSDEDGSVSVVDCKDMIISGAENIHPAEVESALHDRSPSTRSRNRWSLSTHFLAMPPERSSGRQYGLATAYRDQNRRQPNDHRRERARGEQGTGRYRVGPHRLARDHPGS